MCAVARGGLSASLLARDFGTTTFPAVMCPSASAMPRKATELRGPVFFTYLVTGSSGQARRGAADDGRGITAGRKHAEGGPPAGEGTCPAVVGQPGRDERVRHGR